MTTNAETIRENSLLPKSVEVDGQKVERHPVADQIAADEYADRKAARNKSTLPIRLAKIRPGGIS